MTYYACSHSSLLRYLYSQSSLNGVTYTVTFHLTTYYLYHFSSINAIAYTGTAQLMTYLFNDHPDLLPAA